jgi:hypothetical protein
MINNSPRSGPAASSATSNRPHGALHLAELHRFTNPAEAAASLTLRDGKPEALNFYLDHGRVHVGDLATTTEDAFTAWILDRSAGLDAIMLAPTRELVADLNHRARTYRLNGDAPGREVRLADGNQASVGDVIITRANDRRPTPTPSSDQTPSHRAVHLLALAAETGQHPFLHLQTAAFGRDLSTAGDMAAVLYWRLPELTPTNPGPLPWLPGIPPTLHAHPVWRDYLAKAIPASRRPRRPGPRPRLPR